MFAHRQLTGNTIRMTYADTVVSPQTTLTAGDVSSAAVLRTEFAGLLALASILK